MATLATSLLKTIVLSSKATSIVSNIGTDLIINTISTSTSSICNVLSYLTTNTTSGATNIINTIKTIDLEFTVNILNQLVKEQEGKHLNESIKKALIGVSEILDLINNELLVIKEAIKYHNMKYFNEWRNFAWSGDADIIIKYNMILHNRYKMLFRLLKIYPQ